MKKRILAIIALATTALTVAAQPPQWNGSQMPRPEAFPQQQGMHQQQGQQQKQQQMPKFDPAEFLKRMEDYISMKAGLTKEEGEKFFPTYREFKNKQRELTFKQQTLKRAKPANDKEYDNVLKQIADLSVEIAKLDQTYFPKLSKLIPAKKLYLVLQAEDDFHRGIVRQPGMFGTGQFGGNAGQFGGGNGQRGGNRPGFGMPQQHRQQGQQKNQK